MAQELALSSNIVVPPSETVGKTSDKWLLWCPTAKAGSSNIGRILARRFEAEGRDLRGFESLRNQISFAADAAEESESDISVSRASIKQLYPHVLLAEQLSDEQRMAACGAPEALVSVVVRRNPWERLVSGYVDKLLLERRDELTELVPSLDFADLVRLLQSDRDKLANNPHFMSVEQRCDTSTQPFTHVLHLERLDTELEQLVQELAWPSKVLHKGAGRGRSKGKWDDCDDACRAAMDRALGSASLDDFDSTAALAAELFYCFGGKPRNATLDLIKAVEGLYPDDVQEYKPPRRGHARTC